MSTLQPFYYGTVIDCEDPDKLGRIKVSIESSGEEIESDWLPMLTLHAGTESGFFAMPDVDDQVIVAYLDHHHQNGVVLGGIWNPDNPPPQTEENADSDLNADGKNNLKFYRSNSGLRLIFDDTEGKEKIQLLNTDAKTRFEFDVAEELINIETDQDISIIAKKNIAIEAEEIEIKTEKATGIEADGLSLKSSKELETKSDNDTSITGSNIVLN
jgi:phage baseplate assembly protein gpV